MINIILIIIMKSERADQSGLNSRIKEVASINLSLTCLGNEHIF
jgi:hypothetical protein